MCRNRQDRRIVYTEIEAFGRNLHFWALNLVLNFPNRFRFFLLSFESLKSVEIRVYNNVEKM